MDEALEKRLKPFRTDHLILLVGANPLPNYVVGRLLTKSNTKIHLLCSSDTQPIAERLGDKLPNAIVRAKLDESKPQDIQRGVTDLLKGIKTNETVGLHYTGGTKAMSVHAYLAIKKMCGSAVYSYLDARHLQLVVDNGKGDGRDDEIHLGSAIQMTVTDIASLHKITFGVFMTEPILLSVCREMKRIFETDRKAWSDWKNWAKSNLFESVDGGTQIKSDSKLRAIAIPSDKFEWLCEAFASLGAKKDGVLTDWLSLSPNIKPPTERTALQEFAEWLSGGFWQESLVLNALKAIQTECSLNDLGMNYRESAERSKFEFDVAAVRGYQLFAFSCTTERSEKECKKKLFEAFARAKQMGGDEAKVALVCYSEDPDKINNDFKNENFFVKGSVRVFGAKDMRGDLAAALKGWITQ